MKIDTQALYTISAAYEVRPGNIYPGKGGRQPRTEYWLVVSVCGEACHLLGFTSSGEPCSTASYNIHAMRPRPILGRVDLSKIILSLTHQPEDEKGGA